MTPGKRRKSFKQRIFVRRAWDARCRYRVARARGDESDRRFFLGQMLAYLSVLKLVYWGDDV
ncbi:MAG: hypothetical protein KAT62_00590 [Desulfuromonadales bacterium]|nr:hypothetical protein [Desulfuromonadales bacterium]